MMDESMAPSNTPPCNAVYDGCNYYYLPWSSDKPCVCVESYWENIAFRLEPLNALLRIIDRVVRLDIALISRRKVDWTSFRSFIRFYIFSLAQIEGVLVSFSQWSCMGFIGFFKSGGVLMFYCWYFSFVSQGDVHRLPGYLLCFPR